MKKKWEKQKGFTLIEVIVTIIIAALVGTVIFVYLGNTLAHSHKSLIQVKDLADSVELMEEIAMRYNKYLSDPGTAAPSGMACDWLTGNTTPPGSLTLPEGVSLVCNPVNVSTGYASYLVSITKNDQTISGLFTE